jgi:hypothetical protein
MTERPDPNESPLANSNDAGESPNRLWGIDLIAGVYGLAALLCVWLFFVGSLTGCVAAVILGPLCASLSVGIFHRRNTARVVLLVLLSISLVGSGLLAVYYCCAAMGVVASPANKEPLSELARMPLRVGLTLAMFFYLRRSDVRQAFVRRDRA